MMNEEFWKEIKNYPNYLISNLGMVKRKNSKVLKPELTNTGYLRIGLSEKGKRRKHSIHRLVAQHFLADWNPELIVDHIDENKINNRWNNLRMCTTKQNNTFYYSKQKHSSKYQNVGWQKQHKKWYVLMHENKKKQFIGYFDNEEDAHKAVIYAEEFGAEKARQKYLKRNKK